jgi:hypothetical protein
VSHLGVLTLQPFEIYRAEGSSCAAVWVTGLIGEFKKKERLYLIVHKKFKNSK